MIALYVFSLVLGGGFLALSLFGDLFGGHADVDLGGGLGDADVDFDAHFDGDAGGHDGPDAAHAASKIFSLRTVIYSLFGFGAVGTLITYLGVGASPSTTAALSAATGLASGALINTLFGWVRRTGSGELEEDDVFDGHLGRVTLPIEGGGGKILVEIAGREVELRALPHTSALGESDPATWRRVLVVEMERGIAYVTPVADERFLTP